jgi:two-component system sensor histidine kinase KdpD
VRYAVAVLLIATTVALLKIPSANAGAAAPVLLLMVVISARFWGIGPALVSAAIASAALTYYFLPPEGFEIEDPDDWIAFASFTVTAVVAGELASRAERRTAEAHHGRLEIERLYGELQGAFDRASEAEAARRNEQLKAALLDALTHNLRTPLTAIKAAVTAMLHASAWSERPVLSREGQHELLEVIDEESDRLNRFIEGLSAADGSDALQPLTLRPIPATDIVRSALARAETLTRDYRLVVDIPEGVPAVCADKASIAEVIYMLLDNASKYAPPGTTIRVAARQADSRNVELSVADEGPGIDPSLRERVFDKFFRVPGREPQDRRRGGVGLGLPIARRLVEAQAGRIWIEAPAAGHGTTVAMTLPISTEAPVHEPLAAGAARQ